MQLVGESTVGRIEFKMRGRSGSWVPVRFWTEWSIQSWTRLFRRCRPLRSKRLASAIGLVLGSIEPG